jgi:hypothetical protein
VLLLLPVWFSSNQACQSHSHAARAFYLLNKYQLRESSRKYWPAAAAVCGVESISMWLPYLMDG